MDSLSPFDGLPGFTNGLTFPFGGIAETFRLSQGVDSLPLIGMAADKTIADDFVVML